MTTISLQRRVLVGMALAACLAAAPGFAQTPNQKILKIIAPIPPGSAMERDESAFDAAIAKGVDIAARENDV